MTVTSSSRIAASLLVVAAAGHALAVPHHADPGHGGVLYGVAFAAVAVAQLAVAAAMLRWPAEKWLRQLAIVSSLLLTALWAVSRTRGLPLGSHAGIPEAVGILDALTVASQLGVVGLLAPRRRRRRVPIALASSFAAVMIGVAAFNMVDLVGPGAAAIPHGHSGTVAGQDDSSQVGAEAPSEPTVRTSHQYQEPTGAVEAHSYDGGADHPHPSG